MSPKLALAVQYAADAPDLPRWRLRRWVARTVEAIAKEWASASPPVKLTDVQLTIRLVDSDEGQSLNRDFRDRDYPTNVLTFEYGMDENGHAAGDIVLCVPVLQREAAEQKKAYLDHAAHLVVHGVLHALGYDHIEPDEAEDMEALEVSILSDWGIANPYTDG